LLTLQTKKGARIATYRIKAGVAKHRFVLLLPAWCSGREAIDDRPGRYGLRLFPPSPLGRNAAPTGSA
jgi:hypothetical protein